ncbi:MAG: NAD-dependent epimerase/dehydratase family protein [Candidatus Neomarinimicrobiota bacterium]
MRILITGSSGYLGTELCRRSEKADSVAEVIGVDLVKPRESFSKLTFYQEDCVGDLSHIFDHHKIDTVVHLVFVLDPIHDSDKMYRVNVSSLENVLAHIEKYGTKRLLVTSSYTAYGAHPDNPVWITEDQPLRGNKDFQYSRDKTIIEDRLRDFQARSPKTEVVIARPALVAGPNISNFISRYLSKPIVPLVKDLEEEMQFLHEDDASEALFQLATAAPPGAYNLGPSSTVHPAEAARIMGGKPVSLRPGVLRFLTALGWTLRLKFLSEAPKSMISFMQYPCSIDGTKVERETGFRYRYSSFDAIHTLAETLRNR